MSLLARQRRLARALVLLAPLVLAFLPSAAIQAAPGRQLSDDVVVVVEQPGAGETVSGETVIRGWAVDRRATNDSGVRTTPGGVQVWMDRTEGSATGQLIGDAAYGLDRPDLANQYGARFRGSGFTIRWNSCLVPTGRHTLQVFAESAISSPQVGFTQVAVEVGPCPAAAGPSDILNSQPLRGNASWTAIQERTSQLRGLAPRAELYRAPLTPETYARRFDADFAQYYQSQDVDTSRLLLIAFGLLDPGFNLAAALQRFQTSLPIGMYDPDTQVLFVSRDPPESPLARVTMAHEITHALQDQHYNFQELLGLRARRTGAGAADVVPDQQAAARALIEGDAILVQRMYQATTIQDPAELQRLADDEAAASAAVDMTDLPYVVYQSTYFPYLYGPPFIYGVIGEEPLTTYGRYGPAVDQLFRHPPVSTSQILHPDRYRAGVEPAAVELRSAAAVLGPDWVALGDGMLGELDHRIILENWLRTTDPDAVDRATAGWTGDRSAVYRRLDASGAPLGDIAVVLRTRWSTAADAEAWAAQYARTVPLRYSDPERYAGREDLLVRQELGPRSLAWEMPGERAIALRWDGQFSAIAIAPDLELARRLAELGIGS